MMTLRQLVEWAEQNGADKDAELAIMGAEVKYIALGRDGTIALDEEDCTDDGGWEIPPQIME